MLNISRLFAFNVVYQCNKYCNCFMFKSRTFSHIKVYNKFLNCWYKYHNNRLRSNLYTKTSVLSSFQCILLSGIDFINMSQSLKKNEKDYDTDKIVKKRRKSVEDIEEYILKKKRKLLYKQLECGDSCKSINKKYNIFNVKKSFYIDSIEEVVANFVDYKKSYNRFLHSFNITGSEIQPVGSMEGQGKASSDDTRSDSKVTGENLNDLSAADLEKLLRDSIVEFANHIAALGLTTSYETNDCQTDTKELTKDELIDTEVKKVSDEQKYNELREEQFSLRGNGFVSERVFSNEKRLFFKVISYNVLSQALLEENIQLYKSYNPKYLSWSFRSDLLMKELLKHNADILCLQEVEEKYKVSFFDQLEEKGYKGIFKKRTNDKVDGCAIYYKTSTFQLIDYRSVEFFQMNINVLDRDNIGLIAKLHPVGYPGNPIVVATTHLLYNPRRHDVKLAQIMLMLAEIERIAYDKNSKFKYNPVILTGDFNLEPYTSVYQLLLQGFLQYDILDSRKLTYTGMVHSADAKYRLTQARGPMGKRFLPPQIGITDNCTHYGIQEIRKGPLGDNLKELDKYLGIYNSDLKCAPKKFYMAEHMNNIFQTGLLRNPNFDFWSVYHHENQDNETEATTKHDDYVTVDYMLYTPLVDPNHLHHQLQLVNRARLPTISEWRLFIKNIPSEICPSDHLPLVARFFLRVPKQPGRESGEL